MYKSGIILAVVALVVVVGLTLLSPICTPCGALLLGLGAGFLAGVFDKPLDNGGSAKAGAIAGGIGGIGALLGQAIGALLNSVLLGPEGTAELLSQMGVDVGSDAAYASSYWVSTIGMAACVGIFNIALMAGLGALGGLLWWQVTGKNTAASSSIDNIG
ncbi:MAG: hypothetical protein JXB07_06845 [Anaerolineae bacterium]|nr:hypothetical protein [Anaerolineae bacterium]